jgi:hypothetical protein
LYDWLGAESLNQRERFADHSRETFDAVLDTCERIARDKYAPFNRIVDTEEPRFDGEKVILPQATHDAQKARMPSPACSARAGLRRGRHAAALHDGGGGQRSSLRWPRSASAPAC